MNSVFPIEGITKTPSYRWRDYSRVKKKSFIDDNKICRTLPLFSSTNFDINTLLGTKSFLVGSYDRLQFISRAQCDALPALRVKIFLIYRLLTECNSLTSFNKNPNIIWVFHGVACIQDLVA